MPAWSDPAWLNAAAAWIDEQLALLGLTATGAIEQPHVRPWSTALRVPVSGADVWFKANMPSLAYEAAAVRILGRRAPDRVPELLAVDLDRGWMLMADAGESLREVVARERNLARWLDVLPIYARLQLATTGEVDALCTAGVPHRRLDNLASEYALLLEAVQGLTRDESSRLRALQRDVREMCWKLAALGIPDTIQHDDLHDGQVFVRDSGYVVADWGDCCVSHPFFTMAVTLEGNLAWGLDDVADSVDVRPFADAYLEPFAAYGWAAELRAALAIALRLGWICRALNVQRWASSLEPPDRDEHLEGVATRLRVFLRGLS
jgi:phosphotransferase family enzyme